MRVYKGIITLFVVFLSLSPAHAADKAYLKAIDATQGRDLNLAINLYRKILRTEWEKDYKLGHKQSSWNLWNPKNLDQMVTHQY